MHRWDNSVVLFFSLEMFFFFLLFWVNVNNKYSTFKQRQWHAFKSNGFFCFVFFGKDISLDFPPELQQKSYVPVHVGTVQLIYLSRPASDMTKCDDVSMEWSFNDIFHLVLTYIQSGYLNLLTFLFLWIWWQPSNSILLVYASKLNMITFIKALPGQQ